MIRKKSNNLGVNANVSLEPSAASQSTSNINNNIIINKRDDGKEDIVITRDIESDDKSLEAKDIDVITIDGVVSLPVSYVVVPANDRVPYLHTTVDGEDIDMIVYQHDTDEWKKKRPDKDEVRRNPRPEDK